MRKFSDDWVFLIISFAVFVAVIFGIFQLAVSVKNCRETVQVLSEYFSKEFTYKYDYNVGCMLSEDGIKFIPVANIRVNIGE